MKILYLNRSKDFGGFSFEELFKTVKSNLTCCEIEDFYDKTYSSFWKNIQAIRKIKCDVIHITGGIGYYALFLPKKKTILTVHDTNHYEFDLKGIKKWIYGWVIYRLPIMNVKHVTVVSEHTKNNLIRFFNIAEEKIKVIPNCYPSDFKSEIKDSINIPAKLLQIGTKPNKNLKRLIEAITQLNVELTIIGKLTHEMLELLKENEVNYVNKSNLTINEIYQAYLDCDIVTFVSLREGFGLPIIEANVIGRAIISSNTSSMPEVAGISAHLVNPLNIEEIRNGLTKLIENDDYRKKLIINGFENAKKYNPIIIASLYEKLYLEVTKK
jgi:glycosyltransferase involved in cell wall biosynthesis